MGTHHPYSLLATWVLLQLFCNFPWCFLFCYSAENFMNVQFTSPSRSLTKLQWTLTPGSPPSASLPLGASPTWFSARPDCKCTKMCSYHTFALHVKTKVPEPSSATSDGDTFSFLPTPCWKKPKLSMAWILRGTPKLGPFFNPMKRKCEKNKIKLQNKMGKWDAPPFKTNLGSCLLLCTECWGLVYCSSGLYGFHSCPLFWVAASCFWFRNLNSPLDSFRFHHIQTTSK